MTGEPAAAPAAPRPRRARRVLLALLLLLAASEIGLRVLERSRGWKAPGWSEVAAENGLYQPHPYVGYTLRPGDPRTGVNALGLRGPPTSAEKPAGTFRIACLGGSTTFGPDGDPAASYPAQLEALLQQVAPAGVRYEVLNCGVPGYTTAESLVNFALRVVEMQPDALVVYHAVNDARLVQTRTFLPDYSHVRKSWDGGCVSRLEQALLVGSATWRGLARALDLRRPPARLEQLLFVADHREQHVPAGERPVNVAGLSAFSRNLGHLVALARSHGMLPAFATFAFCDAKAAPERQQDLQPTVRAMNDVVRNLGGSLDVPVFGVAEVLDEHPELFEDFVHLQPAGYRRMAATIVAEARAAGLWGLR